MLAMRLWLFGGPRCPSGFWIECTEHVNVLTISKGNDQHDERQSKSTHDLTWLVYCLVPQSIPGVASGEELTMTSSRPDRTRSIYIYRMMSSPLRVYEPTWKLRSEHILLLNPQYGPATLSYCPERNFIFANLKILMALKVSDIFWFRS